MNWLFIVIMMFLALNIVSGYTKGFLRTIYYIYVFLRLQISFYDERLVSRNALFCGFPAGFLLLHSFS